MTFTRHRALTALTTVGEWAASIALVTVASGASIATLTLPDPVVQSTLAPIEATPPVEDLPGIPALDITGRLDAPPVPAAPNELVLWPEDAVRETTPMVSVQDTAYVVPEESPDGGYVLPFDRWLDNSPVYDDGWVLLVDDLNGTITWHAPIGDCAAVDWTTLDADGALLVPFDANGDQRINCGSDVELGA